MINEKKSICWLLDDSFYHFDAIHHTWLRWMDSQTACIAQCILNMCHYKNKSQSYVKQTLHVKMKWLTSLAPAAKPGGKYDSSSVTLLPGSYNTQYRITYYCLRMHIEHKQILKSLPYIIFYLQVHNGLFRHCTYEMHKNIQNLR